jgi:hypothetical protein
MTEAGGVFAFMSNGRRLTLAPLGALEEHQNLRQGRAVLA